MTENKGDLISREALKEKLNKKALELANGGMIFIESINHIIDNAPTVDTFTFDDMKKGINVGYKAGRLTEKWERPQGEWISADERLPEDMIKVLVWFEYYRYGDFNCMYQTYGFGYVCDGKWSDFINGETGWQDARIIAWQPLPEPYIRGEENETD